MEKKCTKCGINKNIELFPFRDKSKKTYRRECCECLYLYRKTYRENNREKLAAASVKWRLKDENKEKYKEYRLLNKNKYNEYRFKNKEKAKALNRDWCKNHPEYICYKQSIRRSKIQIATIKLFKKEIKEIYKNCPKGYHVDHIIPLNHPDVCGLHIPANLQYLLIEENLKKSNKFTPFQG